MRLVTVLDAHGDRAVGALRGAEEWVDFRQDPSLPTDMVDLVGVDAARLAAAAELPASPLSEVRLDAPIRPRSNVMCVAKNYTEHVKEFSASGYDPSQSAQPPMHPVVFTKSTSSIVGSGGHVTVSADASGTSDYEGELAVVIGRGGTKIAAEDAGSHVFGYTILNDLTIRALQKRHQQFFIAKSAHTYCAMGPCLVTGDEFGPLGDQLLETRVNGELRQSSAIGEMIFSVGELIAAISNSVMLQQGDVIATGTPSGVAISFSPPRYLVPGDRVDVSVDGIGTLSNRMI